MARVIDPADRDGIRQTEGLPQFSPEFITEVDGCPDVESFRELLDRRGLWLNRQAALDVYRYLRGLTGKALPVEGSVSDEQLAGVIGGANVSPLDSPALVPLLTEVARQL